MRANSVVAERMTLMEPTLDRNGSRRVTIVDVARAANVSVASASKVVREAPGTSDSMRQRVMAKVEELGYRPHKLAQALRSPLKTVGVLLSDLENPFFAMILRGATEVLEAVGYDIFVSPAGLTAKDHLKAMEAFVDHQMAGLLAIAPRGADASLDRVARQVPMVVLGRHGPAESFDTIAGDDEVGARLAVDHLVAEEHRRIAFVANISEASPALPENRRLAGYRDAMIANGLEDEIDVVHATWTDDGGVAAARSILDRPTRPSAVFAGADVVALRVLGELWERGYDVPGDIAVVGYDNSPTSAFAPISLTTVDQQGVEMGRNAARLLLDRLNGRTGSRHSVVTPRLVVRNTSKGRV